MITCKTNIAVFYISTVSLYQLLLNMVTTEFISHKLNFSNIYLFKVYLHSCIFLFFHDANHSVTNSIEQSPWEANSHAASQEISHFLWNPKVNYHVHKSLPLDPLLRQMNPVHTFPSNFHKIPTPQYLMEWV
jgi:hypothetical protein